jgi:hypothetical protein
MVSLKQSEIIEKIIKKYGKWLGNIIFFKYTCKV